MYQSLFFNKETRVQEFCCEFYEISKNTIFTEHLRKLLLQNMLKEKHRITSCFLWDFQYLSFG